MLDEAPAVNNVFVGRQPLLDRALRTVGYELLFRASNTASSAAFVDGDAATAQVVSNALADIGLDNLVGDKLAFVNVTSHFLTNPQLLAFLPPDRVVLEVLEHVRPEPDVINGVQHLVDLGYTIALDDFDPHGVTAPLRSFAAIIKYDLSVTSPNELRSEIARDHAEGRRSLVERVETADDHADVAEAGADYFQGYFFARPSIVAGTAVTSNTVALIRLLAAINEPRTTMKEIVDLLTQDVAMSVKILRVVNSAGHGLGTCVTSIQHAAFLIGRSRLRSWATLLIMSSFDNKPAALVGMALTRAKFCELYAERRRLDAPATFFAVGMLSLLDVMTDTPMESVIAQIPVTSEIRTALLERKGPLAEALDLAIQLEQPIDPRNATPADCDILHRDIVDSYRHALRWASSVTAATLG